MVFLEGNHYYNHSSPTKAAAFLHGMSQERPRPDRHALLSRHDVIGAAHGRSGGPWR